MEDASSEYSMRKLQFTHLLADLEGTEKRKLEGCGNTRKSRGALEKVSGDQE